MPTVALADATIAEAAERLRAGELVAFPTETVYGLGADATNGTAVARIFAAKGRPEFNPLISHVDSTLSAHAHGIFDAVTERLAAAFWPGPLTLVVPRRAGSPISELATAGLDTLAIRVPDHPAAQALLKAVGRPVAAPSANRSGHVSATTADHVATDLGAAVAMILDGGATAHGLESTVLAVIDGRVTLLRPGAVTVETIEALIGQAIERGRHVDPTAPTSPGQLASHYAPRARVRLDAVAVEAGEALLAFGPMPLPTQGPAINLSHASDLIEAAAKLFASLRALDATGARSIAVMPIPSSGLGNAINDRLRRAAVGR